MRYASEGDRRKRSPERGAHPKSTYSHTLISRCARVLLLVEAMRDDQPAEVDMDRDSVHRLLVTLGRKDLLEHGDWLWIHQERSGDVPKAK